MQITRGKIQTAQKVVIYGQEGVGKTTLASQFPNPVFIDTEGGTTHIDVARTPSPKSFSMLKQIIQELTKDLQGFKSVMIDTIDWAENMIAADLCSRYRKSGIEDFGYGKGFTFLREDFGKFLNTLDDLRERQGVHVVLVGHAQVKKFELPEEQGAYDRWELKLTKTCAPLLKEWSDMLLFCAYKAVVEIDENKKAKARGNRRVIRTQHNAAWDAKNRHGLAPELPMAFSSISSAFGELKPVQTAVTAPAPTPQPQPQAAPAPAPKSEGTAIDGIEQQIAEKYPQLSDLMSVSGVSEGEIRRVVALKGYFPQDTPVTKYDDDFVNGKLMAHWDALVKRIEWARQYPNATIEELQNMEEK